MISTLLHIAYLFAPHINGCDTIYKNSNGNNTIESITCYDTAKDGKIVATYKLIDYSYTAYYEGYIDSNHKFIKHGLMYVLDTFGIENYVDTAFVCNYFHDSRNGKQKDYSIDSNGQKYLLHESSWYRGRPWGNWFSYYPDSQHSTYLIIKWHNVNGISYGDATYYFMNNKTKAKGQMRMFTAHLPCDLRSYFCITPPESNNGHCESFTTPIGKWSFYTLAGKKIKFTFPDNFKEYFDFNLDCSKLKNIQN
jgi:hypothetical protein